MFLEDLKIRKLFLREQFEINVKIKTYDKNIEDNQTKWENL